MSNIYVTSCIKNQDQSKYDYEITFSSGLSLGFSDEEVFEHFLYDTDHPIEDLDSLCIKVLSARARRIMISYVASTCRSIAQTKQATSEKLKLGYTDNWKIYIEEAIDKAVGDLMLLGYLDDYDYCRRYINTTIKVKPASIVMIKHELENVRGVSSNIVESVLAEYNIDDSVTAYALLVKKAKSTDDKNKLFGYLMRKGFTYESVNKAYNKYIDNKNELEQEE